MSGITTYVHAGVVVEDLATAVEFFTALGLECDPPMIVEGEWVDRVIDLDGTRIELVMTRAPDGSGEMELVKFHAPDGEADGEPSPAPVNRPGIRHLAYQVDDLRSVVDRVRAAGWGPMRDVVDYDGQYLMCYIRGPEGLIVELAEPLRPRS